MFYPMRRLINEAQLAVDDWYAIDSVVQVTQADVSRSRPVMIDWFVTPYNKMVQTFGALEVNNSFNSEKIRGVWCFQIDDGNGEPFYIVISDYGNYPTDLTKNRVWYAWHQGAPTSGLEYWWDEIARRIN